MSSRRGPKTIKVDESMIDSITLKNTDQTFGGDVDGQFVFEGFKTVAGCDNSAVYIRLKDPIDWNMISCRFTINGYASCWSFNSSSGYGPGPYDGNLHSYDPSKNDFFSESRSTNSWGHTQFQSHSRVFACDNNSNNFYHSGYHLGDPKIFIMKRRRNLNGELAGIYHSTACQGSGTGHNVKISDINIWYEE
jgi:hypothetical protein